MKAPLLLAAVAATALTTSAWADLGTLAENRGYYACLEASDDGFRHVRTDNTYMVSETDASRIYYINATAWKSGEMRKVGFSCETDLSGRLQETREVTYAHFVPESNSVQVAGN